MRFRIGFVSGFATGYYLGAKAGRERYEQLRSTLAKAERLTTKAREVAEVGIEKGRELLDRRSNTPDWSSNGAVAARVDGGAGAPLIDPLLPGMPVAPPITPPITPPAVGFGGSG